MKSLKIKNVLKCFIMIFVISSIFIISKQMPNENIQLLGKVNEKISVDKGIEKIKSISKDPDEQIKYLKNIKTDIKEMYIYEGDKSQYALDANSGNLLSRVNKKAKYSKDISITKDDAIKNAKSEIMHYFPNINLDEMKLITNKIVDRGAIKQFQFTWKKFKGDIDTGTSISVIVEGTGDVVSINSSQASPNSLEQEVKIDEEQAKKIAIDYIKNHLEKNNNIETLPEQIETKIIANKKVIKEKLIWYVTIDGIISKNFPDMSIKYFVSIDVTTGEVINLDRTR